MSNDSQSFGNYEWHIDPKRNEQYRELYRLACKLVDDLKPAQMEQVVKRLISHHFHENTDVLLIDRQIEHLRSLVAYPDLENSRRAAPLLDQLADILRNQGFTIIQFLWDRNHSTTYDTLRDIRNCWQDGKSATDEAIQKALKRTQESLNAHPELNVSIEISHEKRRVRLIRPDK